eukprot:scaffold425542_cov617-Attheya_sp.AAC.1
MAISSTERRAKNVQIFVEKDAVETNFAKWAQPGHFSRTLAKAWLTDPIGIKQSSQVVWPIVGQEILNADVGGNFQGIQTTSGWFQMWRAEGWFHYHKAAPKLEWFQNAESMMNHHLAGCWSCSTRDSITTRIFN